MKRRLLSVILVLAMLMSSVAILASCENEEQPTETETEKADSTESETKSGETSETKTETESGATSETESESGAVSETESESGATSETESESGATSETESESGATSETESESGATSETESESGATSETESESGAASETESESGATSETESESEAASETESDSETASETETELPNYDYATGEDIKDAGVVWAGNAFALTDYVIDESAAVTVSAEEMLALLIDKTAMKQGEVYKVTEPLVFSSNTKYYGNLAAVIAEGGIVIENADGVVLKELIVKGNITIKNSSGVIFYKLDLRSQADGVTIDGDSSDVAFKNCKITAESTAILSGAPLLVVYKTYISADKGIVSTGNSFALQSSQIDAVSLGVSTSGEYCTVKGNTVSTGRDGLGIVFDEGSVNGLAALNTVKVAQTSISVNGSLNCVVLMNNTVTVEGKNNVNLYVVENSIGGLIKLYTNKYLLCDENKFADDGKIHLTVSEGNTEFNGNNLQDTDARLEYGANEDLLPHTNKELFVGMERRGQIRDASLTKAYSFNSYIRTMARSNSYIIIPPGAYSVTSSLNLEAEHSNTTIYAYGVYEEKDAVPDGADRPVGSVSAAMGTLISISASAINIQGLTLGYDFQSSGQAYVLEKWEDDTGRYIRVVSGAGWNEEFAESDTTLYDPVIGLQMAKGDESYSWINWVNHQYIRKDSDGTMVFKITHGSNDKEKKEVFNNIEPGDIIACRLEGDNRHTISISGSNILLKDFVLYGYTSGIAIYAGGTNVKNIQLERFNNTNKSSPIIDEATYNKYKALEAQYGMTSDGDDPLAEGAQGLEVYIDEQGRYRGSLPRYGSVDGTHIVGAAQGVSATSSIFEHMVDDASNQRASSARIAGVIDNGDGTTSIYIKGSLSLDYYGIHSGRGYDNQTPGHCPSFSAGNTMFAYNANGRVLIEAQVISASKSAGALPEGCHMVHTDKDSNCLCDVCNTPMHTDVKKSGGSAGMDCKCDKCGITVHTDYNISETWDGKGDNKCNACQTPIIDNNLDGFDDVSGNYIITDMATSAMTTYDSATSTLSYKIYTGSYLITYNTPITVVTVKTKDVDFDAIKGIDFTDNNTYMSDKVICDNISLNSTGFTFDNVLMQEYHSRGILMKTRDSKAIHCTFRDVACAGMLLSVETTWGESTVPKNTTIEGCLFDNTGHSYGRQTALEYSPISIHGLGDITCGDKEISEKNLPCENIKIIGNKFINTNSYYVITISDAQNVEIKDNIIACRTEVDASGNRVEDTKYGRAIYIERCMNVTISGNKYSYGGGKVETGTHIVAWDYKGLQGTDLYDAEGNRFASLPEEKGKKP